MTTETDIWNLSLSHIGDDADLDASDPVEDDTRAEHCARFYPIARNKLLEMHTWSFATRRSNGAEVDNPTSSWGKAYARPEKCKKIISVLPPGAIDDYVGVPAGTTSLADGSIVTSEMAAALQQTQPFVCESLTDDTPVILTNQHDAVIRWIALVTTTSRYTDSFIVALSRLLASYLAGPIIKGDIGRAEAKEQYRLFLLELSEATKHDSQQRQVNPQHVVPWISGR